MRCCKRLCFEPLETDFPGDQGQDKQHTGDAGAQRDADEYKDMDLPETLCCNKIIILPRLFGLPPQAIPGPGLNMRLHGLGRRFYIWGPIGLLAYNL